MTESAIQAFLTERKEAWLRKNLKQNFGKLKQQEIQEEADRLYSFPNWINHIYRHEKLGNLVSHVAKFSHPGAKKTTPFIAKCSKNDDGFFRYGNVEGVETDCSVNAAYIAKGSVLQELNMFLEVNLSDERSILAHLNDRSEVIQKCFSVSAFDFEEIREEFLAIKILDESESATSVRLKQVYFPVADVANGYHLLSILNSSGMMFALKDRINQVRFSEETKQAREDRKNKAYNPNGLYEIYDLTAIGFGGTKPQNISVLNSSNGGVAFLLKSMPPELDTRNVRLPKHDFFKQTLWAKHYDWIFSRLNYLLNEDWRNNIDIRQKRDQVFQEAVYQASETLWQVRAHKAGWSNSDTYTALPGWQKNWLDNARQEERESNDDYIDQAIAEFTKWFIKAFEAYLKSSAIVFDDVDIQHFINVADLFDDHASQQIKEAFR